ncbi:hypothetical protein BZB76_4630 [Actinomadura pelletieri DSM 43383]|uniref:Uncharacterized protein n=1 Tax=Actinomadura pelletieri DSM 43383 TaxID=1120940 RepID=A0A495QI30_9ACTN|nr:hypothetical protein [Actinomadura pelletieri]RKS71820.1 hypothetical protein BZB76_4630 [Actinomadura pelletieri DSM 43383]
MSRSPQTFGGRVALWLILGALTFGAGAITYSMYNQANLRYQVGHGSAGTPGTVHIDYWMSGKSSGCYGRFRPNTGEPSSTVIRINGLKHEACKRNTTVPARLLKGDGGGFLNTDDRDEAFTADSNGGWLTHAVVATVFAILTLILGIPWALLTVLTPLAALTITKPEHPHS